MKVTIPANIHSFREQKQPTTNNDHNRTDNRETIQEANLQHPHTVKTNKKIISQYNMYTCVQFKQAHFHKNSTSTNATGWIKRLFLPSDRVPCTAEWDALHHTWHKSTNVDPDPFLVPVRSDSHGNLVPDSW